MSTLKEWNQEQRVRLLLLLLLCLKFLLKKMGESFKAQRENGKQNRDEFGRERFE